MDTSVLAQVASELNEQRSLTQLFEKRYNEELQKGMQLELSVMQLQRHVSELTAKLSKLEEDNNPPKENTDAE